jgi:hypothetical protein
MKKCIVILSNKSSGSSACQKMLAKYAGANVVGKTPHYQNETLYWTKAASILGMPQAKMLDSNVPYSPERSYQELVELLKDNLGSYDPPSDLLQLIFNGWALLCDKYAPIFLEKSPHHLYQWSSLELIIDCIDALKGRVDFLLIGLIRNPMDVLYSAFRRWRTPPEKLQYEWLVAYKNLLKLKDILGDKLIVIRYEDIIHSISYMKPVFDFCGVSEEDLDLEDEFLHQKSLLGWRDHRFYGFKLAEEVFQLAIDFGYSERDLLNESKLFWPIYKNALRQSYQLIKPIKMKIVDSSIRGI